MAWLRSWSQVTRWSPASGSTVSGESTWDLLSLCLCPSPCSHTLPPINKSEPCRTGVRSFQAGFCMTVVESVSCGIRKNWAAGGLSQEFTSRLCSSSTSAMLVAYILVMLPPHCVLVNALPLRPLPAPSPPPVPGTALGARRRVHSRHLLKLLILLNDRSGGTLPAWRRNLTLRTY